MGIRYSATIEAATPVAAGAAYAELLASATRGAVVHAIRVETKNAVGAQLGLARSFAIGTGTSYATGVAHRLASPTMPIGTALSRLQAAWSSAPTGFLSRLRDEVIGAATGTLRQLWSSDVDGPLVIEPGKSIVVMNPGSGIDGAALKIGITWEEGDVSSR